MSPLVGPLVAVAAIVWLVLRLPDRPRRRADVPDRGVRVRAFPALGAHPRVARSPRGVAGSSGRRRRAQRRRSPPARARPVGIAVAWLVSAAAAQFTWRWTSPKRPLVMTARMRRLLIAGGFLAVLLSAGLALGIVALHPDRVHDSRAHRGGAGDGHERDPAGCCQCRHKAGGGADPAPLPGPRGAAPARGGPGGRRGGGQLSGRPAPSTSSRSCCSRRSTRCQPARASTR